MDELLNTTSATSLAIGLALLVAACSLAALLLVPFLLALLLRGPRRGLRTVLEPLAYPLALAVLAFGTRILAALSYKGEFLNRIQHIADTAVVVLTLWALLGLYLRLTSYFNQSENHERAARWLRGLRLPVVLALALASLNAVGWVFDLDQKRATELAQYSVIGLIVLAALGVYQALGVGFFYYRQRFEGGSQAATASLVQKLFQLGLLVVAFLIVLDQLGVKITTLVTSLGIAGLAASLALQDTLSNLFAGIYLNGSRPVRPGDYIKLESGEEGFVVEVGWRHTSIRPWNNSLVIIPNAKLASSTTINYTLPVPELSTYVWCGVSYESDLDEVEEVALAVATELQAEFDGAPTEWEPAVRFKEFGDSNITFVVALRANSPSDQYRLSHEYVKRLHKAFKARGLTINYPVRRLVTEEPLQLLSMAPPPAGANEPPISPD